ncbi:MAG: NAD(P)/FAD-dependent oxidoreductase [Burkholderiaceae bacterium]
MPLRLEAAAVALASNSYYEATAHPAPQRAALQDNITTDVCVVGGGLAGISTALELAERGYNVVLLEARRVGWAASGRNGGQALIGFASDQDEYEKQLGLADAKRAFNITIEALELLRARIAKYNIACDWVPGALSCSVTQAKAKTLDAWVEKMRSVYGYTHLSSIAASDIGGWVQSKRYVNGAIDTLGGHLHPLNYTRGLAAAAENAGAKIYEQSPVLEVTPASQARGKARVKTAGGEVRANFVMLAGNMHLGGVAPSLEARIMPVGTYIMATAPLEKARADALIKDRAAVCDTQFVLDYYRVTGDDRMLFGGRVSYSTRSPANLKETMRAKMLRVFPQLADVAADFAWGGFVDISMNRAPDFGRVAPDVLYLQGFSGHGVALTGIAGKLAAEVVAGQAERFDLLARIKHQSFPGGDLLRMPALVLGMAYYRLRDYL